MFSLSYIGKEAKYFKEIDRAELKVTILVQMQGSVNSEYIHKNRISTSSSHYQTVKQQIVRNRVICTDKQTSNKYSSHYTENTCIHVHHSNLVQRTGKADLMSSQSQGNCWLSGESLH